MNLFKNSHEGNFEFIQLPLILEVFHLFFVFFFFYCSISCADEQLQDYLISWSLKRNIGNLWHRTFFFSTKNKIKYTEWLVYMNLSLNPSFIIIIINVYGVWWCSSNRITSARNSSKFAVLSPSRHQKQSPPPPPMAETSVSSTAATTPPPLPPWSEEIECILDNSLREMPIIGAKDYNPIQQEESANTSACALCCLVKNR